MSTPSPRARLGYHDKSKRAFPCRCRRLGCSTTPPPRSWRRGRTPTAPGSWRHCTHPWSRRRLVILRAACLDRSMLAPLIRIRSLRSVFESLVAGRVCFLGACSAELGSLLGVLGSAPDGAFPFVQGGWRCATAPVDGLGELQPSLGRCHRIAIGRQAALRPAVWWQRQSGRGTDGEPHQVVAPRRHPTHRWTPQCWPDLGFSRATGSSCRSCSATWCPDFRRVGGACMQPRMRQHPQHGSVQCGHQQLSSRFTLREHAA